MFCVCVYSPRSLQVFSSRIPLFVCRLCVPCVGFPFVQVLSRHCRFLFLCLGPPALFCAGVSFPLFDRCVSSFVCRRPALSVQGCPPLVCAGSPSVGSLPSFLRAGPSVNPPLCAGSPSVGTCPFLSCVQVFRPLSPHLCVQDPPQRVDPPLSRFCVQVSLCRSPSLCAGLSTPLFVQDPPLWVVPSLSLCAGLPLSVQVYIPPSLCRIPLCG